MATAPAALDAYREEADRFIAALDEEIITTPTINDAICGGQTIITVGPNTEANEQERTNLFNTLRFGALPVSLVEQGVETVDPTLGADFLVQALVAGGVGLLLVLVFMIAYYRLPGVLAALALIFYTLVVYAVRSRFSVPATTFPSGLVRVTRWSQPPLTWMPTGAVGSTTRVSGGGP